MNIFKVSLLILLICQKHKLLLQSLGKLIKISKTCLKYILLTKLFLDSNKN